MSDTNRTYKVWEPLLLSVAAMIGMIAGAKFVKSDLDSHKSDPAISNAHYSGRQVEEIIRFLETKYVGDVNSEELVEKAIKAVLEGLDPHTHYFPPDQSDDLEEKTMGHYVGIGIEVLFMNDSLVVLYPKKDSPAERAGIRPGDHIIAINDDPVPGDSLDHEKILESIKGAKGTKVSLAGGRVGVGAEYHGIRAVDPRRAQLAECLRERLRVQDGVRRQGHRRVAGPRPDPVDVGGGVAVEDRAVLGEGQLAGGVLDRLPVGVPGAAGHVVDLLPVQGERHPQLDQRQNVALPGQHAITRRLDLADMACADRGELLPARSLHVHDAASGHVTLECPGRLLRDLRPRGVRDRR